jgi:ABC-type antimicrobial peptide transport system permease subunit
MTTTPVAPTLTRIASVRFTDAEYSRLQLAAEDRGLSVSQLLRRAALQRDLPPPLPPRMDLEAVSQLRRLGVNLNQAVRVLAQWKRTAPEDKKATWETVRVGYSDLRSLVVVLAARITESSQ